MRRNEGASQQAARANAERSPVPFVGSLDGIIGGCVNAAGRQYLVQLLGIPIETRQQHCALRAQA